MMNRPMGPAPKTPALMPALKWPRSMPCRAMPSGSSSAMSSPSMLSGAGSSRRCGQFMSVRRPPWMGAWPQNFTSGQRLRVAGAADLAVAAGVGRLDDDALTLARAGHDHAAHLVAEHERLVDDGLADAAVLVPVEVGAAEAYGGDAHELLAGGDDGLGFLVDTDVVGAV